MSSAVERATSYRFDDKNIKWMPFGNYQGLAYTIFDVDVAKRTADVMFRFDPYTSCFYHRHVSASRALVVAGEHRVRDVDEATGEETLTVKSGGDVHIEGGGDEGCTVVMYLEAETDLMYEVLEDDLSLKMAVSVQQFKTVWDQIRESK
jgi:hypothetical protein